MPSKSVGAQGALVAVAVLVSAAVHPSGFAAGFAAIPVIGALLPATVIGVVSDFVTLSRRRISVLVGFGMATVAAYWISVVHGLFGVREVAGGWPGMVAKTAGCAAVVAGATAATMPWRQRNPIRPAIAARGRTAMLHPRAFGPSTTPSPGPAAGRVLPGRTGP